MFFGAQRQIPGFCCSEDHKSPQLLFVDKVVVVLRQIPMVLLVGFRSCSSLTRSYRQGAAVLVVWRRGKSKRSSFLTVTRRFTTMGTAKIFCRL